MLSFSHVENKKLLWQTIQKSPLFQKTNVNWTWFQTIFHEMEQMYGYETHKIAELVKINETVIRYMILLEPNSCSQSSRFMCIVDGDDFGILQHISNMLIKGYRMVLYSVFRNNILRTSSKFNLSFWFPFFTNQLHK